MFLLRLILLFVLFVLIRRIFRSWRKMTRRGRSQADEQVRGKQPVKKDYSDLTEQGVDDADFEEIP